MFGEEKAWSALQNSLMSSKPWESWKTRYIRTGSLYQKSTDYKTWNPADKIWGLVIISGGE